MRSRHIGIVFDFDDTLGPDSTSSMLEGLGIDSDKFWNTKVVPMIKSGYDPTLACMLGMQQAFPYITKEHLLEAGKSIKLYAGVPEMLDSLLLIAQDFNIELTYYIVSSGLRSIIANCPIADKFADIFASEYAYCNGNSQLLHPKNAISFTDKTRCLMQISKGLTWSMCQHSPFEVNAKMHKHDLKIPLSNMLFIGDGYSDVPCFSMLTKCGGLAMAVYDGQSADKEARAMSFLKDDRVFHALHCDYTQGSELYEAISNAIKGICYDIILRHQSYQG